MKGRAYLAIVVAAVTSAAVWGASPWVTGHKEPWDAASLYYVAALFAGGLVSGVLVPKPLWAQYVGSVSGQLVYELLFLRIGPLFMLGAIFLLAYSLLFSRRGIRWLLRTPALHQATGIGLTVIGVCQLVHSCFPWRSWPFNLLV